MLELTWETQGPVQAPGVDQAQDRGVWNPGLPAPNGLLWCSLVPQDRRGFPRQGRGILPLPALYSHLNKSLLNKIPHSPF